MIQNIIPTAIVVPYENMRRSGMEKKMSDMLVSEEPIELHQGWGLLRAHFSP